MSRRTLLKRVGIGAGVVVAVAATGAAGWRVLDQGVLTPGEGAAYEAWRAQLTGDGPLSLVRAAVLAANAHDTQPWLFAVTDDRIDLYADRSRNIGAMDPLFREMEVSLGCAIENLVLAARENGFEPTVQLQPDAGDQTHVARVDLTPIQATPSALFDAIPGRRTDRSAFAPGRAVDRSLLDDMAALADEPDVVLLWLDAEPQKGRFGQMTIDATAAIIADPDQARDDFAWYRQDWGEIQRQKDGITMDTVGLGEPTRTLVRLLPPMDREAMQKGWVSPRTGGPSRGVPSTSDHDRGIGVGRHVLRDAALEEAGHGAETA